MAKSKDLRPAIEEIFKKHERRFLLSEEIAEKHSGVEGVALVHALRKEFWELQVYILGDKGEPIEQEAAERLKAQISDKLSLTDKKIYDADWWWREASPAGQDLLTEVKRTLSKATPEKGSWTRKLGYVWKVLLQFVYLALVLGVFSVATTKFETVVIAIMVLTYNAARGIWSSVGFTLSYQMSALQGIYGDLGRAVRMKIPTRPEVEAKQAVQVALIYNLIQGIPLTLGSLFALWKIADAVLF